MSTNSVVTLRTSSINQPNIDIWKILTLIQSLKNRQQPIKVPANILNQIMTIPTEVEQDTLSAVLRSLQPTKYSQATKEHIVDNRFLKDVKNAGTLRLEILNLLERLKKKSVPQETIRIIKLILDIVPAQDLAVQTSAISYGKVLNMILAEQTPWALKAVGRKLPYPGKVCNRIYNILKLASASTSDNTKVLAEQLLTQQFYILDIFNNHGHINQQAREISPVPISVTDEYFMIRYCLWTPTDVEQLEEIVGETDRIINKFRIQQFDIAERFKSDAEFKELMSLAS